MSKLEISYAERDEIGSSGVATKILEWESFMGWDVYNVKGHKIVITDDPGRQVTVYRPYFDACGKWEK